MIFTDSLTALKSNGSQLDCRKTGRCGAQGMRSPGSSVLSGGRSWTEERQTDVRFRSGGPLGALFSLEVEVGLEKDGQRRGLGQ